jgi:S-layer homology domain
VYAGSGQVFDARDLTAVGTITPGTPIVGEGGLVYSFDREQVAVHDSDTLELVRSWAPACTEYPEGAVLHDGWLSPDGRFLVVPSVTGLCLEPVDGSGPRPALLQVEVDTTDGARLVQGVLVVIDEFGEVVVEQEAGNSDSPIWSSYSTWLLEGDYLVVLLRPVDVSGWPYVPTTNGGHALLERGATPIRIEGETLVRITAPPFPYDIITTSPTFWSSIQWLVMTGITRGCGPDTFCPNDYVTRGQMAAFLDRALADDWPFV